jgi:D-glycero-alpha-D-manno-heptose-7-phosphate kinase
MRLTRSPLRITLGGGGSDLGEGGFCVAAAINKYVTIAVSDMFDDTYLLKYSAVEHANTAAEIKHRILRAAIELTDTPPGVEITSMADIPAGTGLGSSGAFTVGVLHALAPQLSRPALAELACRIDTGQQDQWAAVYGGVNAFDFETQTITPIATNMERCLALYYTGQKRAGESPPIPPQPVEFAQRAIVGLRENDPGYLGECFDQQWRHKYQHAKTEFHMDCGEIIARGFAAGAYGGKLIGAGGGGFILFAGEDFERLDAKMKQEGLRKVPFRFDHTGTTTL